MGLKPAAEIFADRAYMEDLSLVPWKQSGAMITDEDLAVERCIKMIKEHKVTAITGKEIEIQGDTLCVHGDGAKALAFVERIKKEFQQEGIQIRNFLCPRVPPARTRRTRKRCPHRPAAAGGGFCLSTSGR